jgi:hypothetical protein
VQAEQWRQKTDRVERAATPRRASGGKPGQVHQC